VSDSDALSDALAISRGERPFTWEDWAQNVHEAETLTPQGRAVVLSMIDAIVDCLGVDWLPRSYERFRKSGGDVDLPLLSMSWWPSNQAPHVFSRLIWLGCQIRMFRQHPGFGKLRKNMQRDLGFFEHGLMQLEVGALAAKAGWSVTFEPPVDPGRPGRGDVLLTRGYERMLVEVKGFEIDQTTGTDMRTSGLIGSPMGLMQMELQVTFAGEIEPDFPREMVNDFLAQLRELGHASKASGLALIATTPGGRTIEVLPFLREGVSHTMPIRHGNEMRRIENVVEAKCVQGAGSMPLWLRINETNLFWAMAKPPDYPRPKLHEFLATKLASFVASHEHVAGVMFSATPSFGVLSGSPEWQNLGGRSLSMFRTTITGFCRETLLVPGPHELAASQLYEWRSWYSREESWLEWGLEQLGIPPITELLALAG